MIADPIGLNLSLTCFLKHIPTSESGLKEVNKEKNPKMADTNCLNPGQ